MTQTLYTVATPNLILDRPTLEGNVKRMAQAARSQGVSLRPHLKTPKSFPVAELMKEGGVAGFTVSTLQEAEHFAQTDAGNLFYAIPLAAAKVSRCAKLLRRGVQLSFLVDTVEAARSCGEAAAQEGVRLPFWIEIDVDGYRTGIDPEAEDFVALARLLQDHPHLQLVGLMSYGGISYSCDDRACMARVAAEHRAALLAAKQRLAEVGIDAPRLSFGSTPAVLAAETLAGIDEVRCGIYAFQDLFQAGIGVCSIDDIALSVLTTVISHSTRRNRLIIDAGALALSKDRSTQGRHFDVGFGLICDIDGQVVEDLYIETVSQELGIVTTRSGAALELTSYPIGTRFRVLPNHADMTAAAFESYTVVDGSTQIEAIWSRANRW